MFSVPLNCWHRMVNASSSPALILVATTAPNMMNLYRDIDWIFNCPVTFPSRFDGSADFFKPKDDIKPQPAARLRHDEVDLIADILNGQLYLDNRRSPGYLRVETRAWPAMCSTDSSASTRPDAIRRRMRTCRRPILVCLKGKGYTYTWPRADGMTPWKDGKTQNIYRQDYEPVGTGHRGALRRRLVPRAFRRQQGAAAADRLVRAQQPPQGQGRRARREGHRRGRDRRDRGRHRHSRIGWRTRSCARNTRRR